METPEYPPNSFSSKKPPPEPEEEKKIERVTKSDAIRRKKGLGRKFKDLVLQGDARSTGRFLVYGVLIPMAKETIIEMGREGIEKLVRGDSYRRRSAPRSGPLGYVSYDRMSMRQDPRQQEPASAVECSSSVKA